MGARHLRLGDTTLDLLLDGIFETPRGILVHAKGEAALASALARWGDRPSSVDVDAGPPGVGPGFGVAPVG